MWYTHMFKNSGYNKYTLTHIVKHETSMFRATGHQLFLILNQGFPHSTLLCWDALRSPEVEADALALGK